MLTALTAILACQLAGEVMVLATGLPIPGPVVGMLLLLVGLVLRGGIGGDMDTAATGLLSHLSLLFVPAGVGVMVHWSTIREAWMALSVALVVSTLIGLAVTALVMQGVRRLLSRGPNR
jgi:holin-like protein